MTLYQNLLVVFRESEKGLGITLSSTPGVPTFGKCQNLSQPVHLFMQTPITNIFEYLLPAKY